MEFLIPVIKVIHVLVSMFLIIVILLQPGKSGDLGSVFGGGTSESVFGSSGAVPFLTKLTRLFAVIFLFTSLALGYFSVRSVSSSVIEEESAIEQPAEKEDSQSGKKESLKDVAEQNDSKKGEVENKPKKDRATGSSEAINNQPTKDGKN